MATARDGKLTIRPLTAARVDDVKTVTRGTWGSTCWDLFPRYTAAQQRALGIVNTGPGTAEAKRREALAKLARRRKNSAGLVAYEGKEPIGFISLGPRYDFSRVANSRATPPVDDVAAWVHDDFAFFGTQAMFRKAGFRTIRGVLPGLRKGWTPRVTMRASCGSSPRISSASPRRSKPAR